MPRPNRVTPEGALIADPARGALMGNRGILHDDRGRLTGRLWAHKAWICCVLRFRGRRRALMQPRRYTELFFLDEATAYAAGHRPCAECRRADYLTFQDLWTQAHGPARAPQIDTALHAARVTRRRDRVTWAACARTLPDGMMIRGAGGAHLVVNGATRAWSPSGYGPAQALPYGSVEVLTPQPLVALVRLGLPVSVDRSALD